MGLIGVLIDVTITAVSRLVADDIKAWLPRVKDRLIEWAVKRLPPEQRDRYAEEWRNNVNDTPGDLSKFAVGFFLVLKEMASIRPAAFGADNLPTPKRIEEDKKEEKTLPPLDWLSGMEAIAMAAFMAAQVRQQWIGASAMGSPQLAPVSGASAKAVAGRI
jgi:hypothetical protein